MNANANSSAQMTEATRSVAFRISNILICKLYRSSSYSRSCFFYSNLSAIVHIKCIFWTSWSATKTKFENLFQRFWAGSVKRFWLSIWWWNSGHQRPRTTRLRLWNTVAGGQFWQCNQCIWKTGRCHRSISWRCTCLNIKHQWSHNY